jgi:hypothetical protein
MFEMIGETACGELRLEEQTVAIGAGFHLADAGSHISLFTSIFTGAKL